MKRCPRCGKDSLALVACGKCKQPSESIPCERCNHPSLKPLRCSDCLIILMPSKCRKCKEKSSDIMMCTKCNHQIIPSLKENTSFQPLGPSSAFCERHSDRSTNPEEHLSFAQVGKAKVTYIEPEELSQREKSEKEGEKTPKQLYQVEIPFIVKYPHRYFEPPEQCAVHKKEESPCPMPPLSWKLIEATESDFEKIKSIPPAPVCPNIVQRWRNAELDEKNHKNVFKPKMDEEKQEITANYKNTGIHNENLGISMKNKGSNVFLTIPKLGNPFLFEPDDVRSPIYISKICGNFSHMRIHDSENTNYFSRVFDINNKVVSKHEANPFLIKHDNTSASNPKYNEVQKPKSDSSRPIPQNMIINNADQFKRGEAASFPSRPEIIQILKENKHSTAAISSRPEAVEESKENKHSAAVSSRPEVVEMCNDEKSQVNNIFSNAHENIFISKDENTLYTAFPSKRYGVNISNVKEICSDAVSSRLDDVAISKDEDCHSDSLINKHESAEISEDEKPHSEVLSSKPEDVELSTHDSHSDSLINKHESAEISEDKKPHSVVFSSKHENAEISESKKPHSEVFSSKPEDVELSTNYDSHYDLLASTHEGVEISKDEKLHPEVFSNKRKDVKISKRRDPHSSLFPGTHEAAIIFKQEDFHSSESSDCHSTVGISKREKYHSDEFSKNREDKSSDSIVVLNEDIAVEVSNSEKYNLCKTFQMEQKEMKVQGCMYECHSMCIGFIPVYPPPNNSRIKVLFTRDSISFKVSDFENSNHTIDITLKSCDIDFALRKVETASTILILVISSECYGYLRKLFPSLSKGVKEHNKIIFGFDSKAEQLYAFLREFLGVNKIKNVMRPETPNQQSSPVIPNIGVCRIFFADGPNGSIEVNDDDMKSLPENTDLNDTIIDLYAKYIYWEKISDDKKAKVHIFNTQFHEFLATRMKRTDIRGISCWTKKVDIFLKDYLIIPLNRQKHWFLAIVCFPGVVSSKKLDSSHSFTDASALITMTGSEAKAELKGIGRGERSLSDRSISAFDLEKMGGLPKRIKLQEEKWPCIYFFNSTRTYKADPEEIATTIRCFLEVQWKVKKGYSMDFNTENLPTIIVPSPQQCNQHDCGLYILQYMLTFLKEPVHYNGKTIPNLSSWFTSSAVAPMRMEIQNLIMRKLHERKAKSS